MKMFMEEAIEEAKKAAEMGEIPVGAVIVRDGEIIARGHNMTETLKDPTAHAEIMALREAASLLGGWRLIGCDMYVTVEPCCMCAGALVWSRINKLFIGAMDPKAGACGSLYNIACDERLNHRITVETGLMEEDCSTLMKDFYRGLRNKNYNSEDNKR